MIRTTHSLILLGFLGFTNSCGIKEQKLFTGDAGSCTTSMQLDFQICSAYSYRVTTDEDPREETVRDLSQNCTESAGGTWVDGGTCDSVKAHGYCFLTTQQGQIDLTVKMYLSGEMVTPEMAESGCNDSMGTFTKTN